MSKSPINLEYITARSGGLTPKEILKGAFPNEVILDAVILGYPGTKIIGVIDFPFEAPLLNALLQKQDAKAYFSALKEGTLALISFEKNSLLTSEGEIPLPMEVASAVEEVAASFATYGGTLDEKGRHVLDLCSPYIGPHHAVNLLLGDREKSKDALLSTPKSAVDAFGGGSFRGHDAFQILATKWDMNPQENGNPFNRQFYLVENGKQIFYSHNVHENVKKATCIHEVNRTIIAIETECGLSIQREIYLRPYGSGEPEAVETQKVTIVNQTGKPREISIVFTGMFGSANPGCQMVDVIYQTVINQTGIVLDEDKNLLAITPDYYPAYCRFDARFFGLKSSQGYADGFSANVGEFLGSGSIEHPENVAFLPSRLEVKGPSFFAVSKTLSLLPKKPVVVETYTGSASIGESYEKDLKEKLQALFSRPYVFNGKGMEKFSSFLQIEGEGSFASYVNANLPFQIKYQTFVSRAFAQTQKGYREIGFREIQDLFASMHYLIASGKQSLAETLLSNWIKNVYEMGYVNHNFYYQGKEPGMCSDDGLWLLQAIGYYLDLTGNVAFLKKRFPMAGSKKTRSLYDTLKAIITYSADISVGKHGLPLLDRADWNDCLRIDNDCIDGPTKERLYKKQLRRNRQPYGARFESDFSESVMNAFLLVIAEDKMMEIAGKVGDEGYKAALLSKKEALVASIKKNAFINGYYARVLINRENPMGGITYIGAPGDGLSILDGFDGSLYLNSLSWSILSGVASEEDIASMMKLADTFLKTPYGYKLCTPHNLMLCGAKEAATEQYFLGDRENGGVFKHATMMFASAMFVGARAVKDPSLSKTMKEDAYFMMDLVYPYNNRIAQYQRKGNLRFCTQYVNSITGEHIGPILSGTASWLFLSLKESLGLTVKNGTLALVPMLREEQKEFGFLLRFKDATYRIRIEKAKTEEVVLNGEKTAFPIAIKPGNHDLLVRITK